MKTNLIFASLAFTLLATLPALSLAAAMQPPAGHLKVWMGADRGVITNADGTIASWADQAPALVPGGADHSAIPMGMDVPVLSERANFPSGAHPVITLHGTDGFVLENVLDATTPNVSAYAVAAVTDPTTGGALISNLRSPFGYVLGLSQSTPGAADWYTGEPANDLLSAPLATDQPFLIEGMYSSSTETKFLYTNGVQAATKSGVALNYATWAALTIGARGTFPATQPPDTNVLNVTFNGDYFTGDIAEVLLYDSQSTSQRLAVEAYFYQKYFSVPTGAAAIAKQPVSQNVNELQPVTFAVSANGVPPLSYQWFTNGVAIPGATGPWYTLDSVSRTNAAQFTVVVSNASGTVTSSSAALTVIPDTTRPTLLAADRDFLSLTEAKVVFSKAVSAATATVASNYGINNGVAVSKAVMGATPDTVVLTTSAITFGPSYTLTVSGVSDQLGNVITASSQRALAVVNPNAPIPTTNLKLWLRADLGLTTNASGTVTSWKDQQVGSLAKNGTYTGKPLLVQDVFPNGSHPVIQFNGSSGFRLANGNDMRLTNMTVYLVWNILEDSQMKTVFGNYRDVAGWCIGISDATPDRMKWFTAPPDSFEPEGGQLTVGQYYLTTCSYASAGGQKSVFVGTNLVGSASGVPLVYASGVSLTVGFLGNGAQYINGNVAEVIAYAEVSPAQEALVWEYLNQKYFEVGTGKPVITRQPQSQTVVELDPATFEVGFRGEPPISIQWLRNGAEIPGATNSVYQTSASRTQQGDAFSARLSNGLGTVTSSGAILTVILDTNAPTLVSAFRDYLSAGQVTVVFSRGVASATALIPGNYSISNGASVQQAVFGPNSSTVVLTTSPLTQGQSYTLTVNSVQDLAGNVIATNSRIAVGMPVSSVLPPTSNRVVWLAADAGVATSDGAQVTGWADQAGWANAHNGTTAVGAPELALASNFPNGLPTPVIRFDGDSGLNLDNQTDLELQELSLYVVASVDNTTSTRTIMANYRDVVGWVFGISDTTAGQVKWFTPGDSLEPGGVARVADNTPTVITATLTADGIKTLYINSTNAGSATIEMPVPYDGEILTVGYLSNGGQRLLGDIAEILVYASVDATQQAAVETYLQQKYFVAPVVAAPKLQIQAQPAGVLISWPASATGFALQTTPQIGSGSVWSPVSASVTTANGQSTVSIPLGTHDAFYRLVR